MIPTPSSPPLRLGVLGCADVADRRVLPAVAATPAVRLVAVAARDARRARTFARRHGARAAPDYASLLARDDVDAVYLPLPSGLHAAWIERALLAGKHVLAEKPLTVSAAGTERVVALAERLGLTLRENFMFCHHPMHRQVLRMVADGAVGTLRSFSSRFAIPPRPAGDIRLEPGLGGGALNDTAGYPLRAARLFLGPDLTVRRAALRRGARGGVDTGGAALLSRPDGVTASLTFGIADAYRSTYRLSGTAGRIEVDHVFTTPPDHEPVAVVTTATGTVRVPLPAHDQFRGAVEAFAAAVRGHRDVPGWDPASTIGQARLTEDVRRLAGRAEPAAA